MGRPRGRPRKQKVIATVQHDGTDLFKLITELIQRELTDTESDALVKSCFAFIKDNYSPTQVFDEDVLKEEVLTHNIIKKSDYEDDDIESDDPDYGWGRMSEREDDE